MMQRDLLLDGEAGLPPAKWSTLAYLALLEFAAANARFTAEDARLGAHKAGLPLPPDARAWGGVFKRAVRKGLITPDGYGPRRCGHMTPTIVWRPVILNQVVEEG